jgi:hypothetical protein
MKRVLLSVLPVLLCIGRPALAQGDTEHPRGIVTNVTDTTLTVRTTENQTRTITVDAKAKSPAQATTRRSSSHCGSTV